MVLNHHLMSVMPIAVLLLLCSSFTAMVADAAVVERTFYIGKLTVNRLCQRKVITAVNGKLPGPTLELTEGDTAIIHVINDSPYNVTIHWHGVFQRHTPWSDGVNMITQCPIRPGKNYTYKFDVTGQEGTMFYHAHIDFLLATVHGAIIVRPRHGVAAYPFPVPDKEITLVLGEWYNSDIGGLPQQGFLDGGFYNNSNGFTINGRLGDLCNCSRHQTHNIRVEHGKRYLLRIVCATVRTPMFVKVAGHSFTVVGVDASYTNPYDTDVIAISPGQTVDALMVANAWPGRYYLVAAPYESSKILPLFAHIPSTAIVHYAEATPPPKRPPAMPIVPKFNDTPTYERFMNSLTGLVRTGARSAVPLVVDTHLFVTAGFGFMPCQPSQSLCNTTLGALTPNMNNISFVNPCKVSALEAHYRRNVAGVYAADFPGRPPVVFDFVNPAAAAKERATVRGTMAMRLRYGENVQLVFQNTAIFSIESHPMHIHGLNFFVIARGVGDYNEEEAQKQFNLVNPPARNTVPFPVGGWAVIRFTANNPGVWLVHCHFDDHLQGGLATVLQVDDGPTPDTKVPPPPADYPQC